MKKRNTYLAVATLAAVLVAAGLYRLTRLPGVGDRPSPDNAGESKAAPDGDSERITITRLERPTGEGNVLLKGKGKSQTMSVDPSGVRDDLALYVDDLRKAGPKVRQRSGGREKFAAQVPDRLPSGALRLDAGREEELPRFVGHPELDANEEQLLVQKCLMITDLSVVEDPKRTTGAGPWTFGALMTNIANERATNIKPADFVLAWLNQWTQDQWVNSFNAPQRALGIQELIIKPWQQRSGEGMPLDLTQAPFRLLAIVNRLDLRNNLVLGGAPAGRGAAGEVRFVFCAYDLTDAHKKPFAFTVIFEFQIKQKDFQGVREWAKQWYALKDKPRGEEYNAALQKLTDQFTAAGADRDAPNGSALAQVRTNEIQLGSKSVETSNLLREAQLIRGLEWELREFRILIDGGQGGYLRQVPVKQTPSHTYNDNSKETNQQILARYVNEARPKILAHEHEVPLAFPPGRPFLGAAALAPQDFAWKAKDIRDTEARHLFSLGTCSGCHTGEAFPPLGRPDNLDDCKAQPQHFTHVRPRKVSCEAQLSPFLTGQIRNKDGTSSKFVLVDPADPTGKTSREFHDLCNRAYDLAGLVKYGVIYEKDRKALGMPH